jgi:uncharacterized membrane protein
MKKLFLISILFFSINSNTQTLLEFAKVLAGKTDEQTSNYNSIQEQTLIEFYNNNGNEISACYAYYNNDDKCWTSVGWYTIPAYSSKTINIGIYNGNIYIRGRQGLLTEWGSGDGQFCVDATQAFTIKFADTKDCWSKKKFSKYYVRPGVNKWTFN